MTRAPILPRVFIGSQAVDAGLLTRGQLRSRHFQRLVHSVYTRSTWVTCCSRDNGTPQIVAAERPVRTASGGASKEAA